MARKALKLTSMVVAGFMLASTATGCSGNKGTKSSSTASDQQTTQSQAPVELDWLAYQTNAQPDPNSEIVKMVEKKYNAKFNFWFVDDQKWDDVLNIKLAAGEMPDIMRVKNRGNMAKYVTQGILGELPIDQIKKEAPNYTKMVDKYDTDKLLWNMTKYGGKNYGFSFPTLRGTYPTNLVWRMDWLKNVGIDKVPETLQEFEDAIYKFTNNDPDKNGKKDTYGLSNTAMPAVAGAFGPLPLKDYRGNPLPQLTWQQKDGKLLLNAIQPESKEGLALMQKWYKDGVIDPEFVTGENKGGYWATSHAFINGRVGVTGNIMVDHWNPPLTEGDKGGIVYQEFMKVNPNAEYGKTYVLGKAPVGPKGKSGSDLWGYTGESMVLTSKAVKDPRKVQTILKMLDDYISDEDYNMMVRVGVKGTDYTVNKDGVMVTTGLDAAETRKHGIQIFSFMSDNPDIIKKYNKPLYDLADKVKGTGYYSPPVPSSDAYAKYYPNLQRLTTEYYIKIITGEKSIDSFDEFVKSFKSNGGDEVEKATNDEWNKIIGK